MAFAAALFGTMFIFGCAYLLEKTRGMPRDRARRSACWPRSRWACPGMVLGLGYILFFNHPDNPLNVLYGTLTILVLSTIVHYYTSSHLTAVTALKALDNEFESVSASLKVPFYKTFFRVTVPVCLPAILDIGRYLFVNAMVTISAVVFLYSPDTAARVDRDPQPRRGRRDRPGGGDGDADRRELDASSASLYALVDARAR